MLTNFRTALAVSVCLFIAGGCSSYHQVTDPHSGRQYYTSSMDERGNGSVTLKDGRTGEKITVQNSQVKEITKEKYESARATSGELSPEAQAAAQRQAEEQQAAAARMAEEKMAQAKADEAKAAADKAAADAAEAELAAAKIKAAASPQQLRADLVAARDQVDRILGALTELTSPTQADLKGAYTTYGEEVDRLNAHAQKIKLESDAMRQGREAYFAKWDAQVAATDNPTIRAAAEAKRTRLRAAQEKISADSTAAKDAYAPFMKDLQDTRAFLSKEVSKDTVSVLAPTVKKAQADGQTVKARLDALIADLDAVENAADTAGAAIPPPATPTR